MQAALLTLALVTGGPVDVPAPGYAGQGYAAQGSYDVGGYDTGASYGVETEYLPHTCIQPQTCYAPRFGCYYGGDRYMHRYPAFHGYYWRQPYNYRNVFDYPWHAGLHEPTSLYAYNVEEQGPPAGGARPLPTTNKATRGVTRKPTRSTLAAQGHSGAKPMKIAKTPRAVELESRLALIEDELDASEQQAIAEAESLRRDLPENREVKGSYARQAAVVIMPRPTIGTLVAPQNYPASTGPALSPAPIAPAIPPVPAAAPAPAPTALPTVEAAEDAPVAEPAPVLEAAHLSTKKIEASAGGWKAKSK